MLRYDLDAERARGGRAEPCAEAQGHDEVDVGELDERRR